ncbi:enhancer of mRNA-decapping protein 4-like [Zingiber officinale]|uniref:enhancer of mRNA-decapping protein 4-like n=1 Tax=Zingiber officinale TaxID=94328 RepID=UPI001C4D1D5E|nr:enhancer of mRNA-decapping protein 4-like [Zingiber officinale]
MASPGGGPNTSAIYDTQALLKPPSPSPGAIPRQPFPPTSAYPSPLPPSTFPTPTHPGAFSYPMATPPFHHHPFLHYPQESLHRLPVIYPPVHPHLPNPNPSTNPSTTSNTNPGARLMALLNPPASPQLEPAVSMPPPSSTPSDFLMPSTVGVLHPMPSAPHAALAQPAPTRLPSNKLPRGRLLSTGAHAVYDVDSRLPGENQPPQLEVTPITKYISDPGLVLGRQIAVSRTYICYGLKLGAVRVLNINTALRSLLKGHSQVSIIVTSFEEESHSGDDIAMVESKRTLLATAEEDGRDSTINATEDITEPSVVTVSQSLSVVKGKKQKGKQHQTSSPSSPSSTLLHSTYSLNESALSENAPLVDPASTDILAMQEMLSQVVNMQKELQKQMSVIVAAPVAKEGKRMETSLSRNIEKMIKANGDALWARVQEENAKYEKFDKERMQQITNLIANNVNKDLPTILERAVKKELSAIGSTVARSVAPAISSAIAESFQRGVGDKAVTQLEKSVSSKLEATVARQIQVQFQNSGKQILQDSLRSCLESSVVPAFEQSCKAMFEQVDNAFQKGMNEHAAAAHQQLEAANTPLAVTLREAISSASSITQSLTTELIDGQRKILALIAAGNTKVLNPLVSQQANGPTASPPEMQASLSLLQVGAHLDPTKELSRLISERKYEEAFTLALQRSDVSIVSWLCAQVDLHAICSTVPLPLSQGVLLALLQQMACDIGNETSRKVGWMTDVAVVINPADQMIALHVRPIFEQVYSLSGRQRALPTTTAPESAIIRLLMHVINSVLTSCK